MLTLLKLIPLRDWCWAALLALAIAAGCLFVHHERELGAARAETQLEHERAAVAAVAASAAASSAAESQRRETALQEIANASAQVVQKLAVSSAANAADRSSFGLQLDAYARSHALPSGPAPAASSAAADDAILVLSRLLDRADSRASDLASLADQRGAAGSACVSAYDALTPPTTKP